MGPPAAPLLGPSALGHLGELLESPSHAWCCGDRADLQGPGTSSHTLCRVSLKAVETDQEMGHRGRVAGPGHTAGEDGARWWPHVLDFAPRLVGERRTSGKGTSPRVPPPTPTQQVDAVRDALMPSLACAAAHAGDLEALQMLAELVSPHPLRYQPVTPGPGRAR